MDAKAKRCFGTLVARYNAKGDLSAWQARYRNPLDGTKKVQRNFPPDRKAEAEQWLDEERQLVELAQTGDRAWIPPTERTERKLVYRNPDGLTFSEYCEWYLAQLRTSKGQPLSALTLGEHKSAIRDLSDPFGPKQLLDITQEDIDQWFEQANKTLSDYRRRRATMMLRRVFNAAVTDGLGDGKPILPANPCRIKTPDRNLNPRNERPLSMKEAHDLADAMPEHLRLVVWLGLTVGGLHMGEICALRLGDIDLTRHEIHINSNVVRQPGHPGYGITTASRPKETTLPMPRLLEPAVISHARRYCDENNEQAFLFTANWAWRTVEFTNPAMLQANIRTAMRKIGRPDGTYRTLRATYAFIFLHSGGTMREAMDMLGIATPQAMAKLCSFRQDDHVAKVTDLCSIGFLPPASDTETLGNVIDDLEKQRRQLSQTIRRLKNQRAGAEANNTPDSMEMAR